ncbi:MAG: ribbon-helix-helix domain-containing protein [Planctomycetales bacterium]
MPVGLLETLDAVTEQQGWNRSQAVREAVQALVKRQ